MRGPPEQVFCWPALRPRPFLSCSASAVGLASEITCPVSLQSGSREAQPGRHWREAREQEKEKFGYFSLSAVSPGSAPLDLSCGVVLPLGSSSVPGRVSPLQPTPLLGVAVPFCSGWSLVCLRCNGLNCVPHKGVC